MQNSAGEHIGRLKAGVCWQMSQDNKRVGGWVGGWVDTRGATRGGTLIEGFRRWQRHLSVFIAP